jgi:hypothetical protein
MRQRVIKLLAALLLVVAGVTVAAVAADAAGANDVTIVDTDSSGWD